ncbi:DUF6090 family protein [Namhaeicola litoreus]|uniref:DUF6090 family protein n=1 Tax=Namhaeicola litoreus TaxID=1052145 RepID=A0ABW3XYI9_9FLAO
MVFFRRIRQELFRFLPFWKTGNSAGEPTSPTGRYLTYALGEILLVVIGILIALQVNNWNEGRKQRLEEVKYFSNLINDLQADDERLNNMIFLSEAKVKAAQDVYKGASLDSIGSLYDFSTNMMSLIFVDEFRPNDNTYEEMKSSGNFSMIRNDDLKLKLMNLRKTYIQLAAAHEHMRFDFNIFLEDFEKYVDWGKYYNLKKSNIPKLDFVFDNLYIESHKDIMEKEVHTLYKNKIFLNNIFLLEINYTYAIDAFNTTKTQIHEIIDILNREIEQK